MEDIGAVVHAPRGLELTIVEGLRAEADAIEAGREPRRRLLGRDGFWIGLERHFEILRAERGADRVEHFRQSRGIEQARRASADVYGIGGLRNRRAPPGDLTAYRIGVGLVAIARNHARVKIAVRAFRLAERYLNVDS